MIEVTAAIIRQNGKILICQRPADKNCGLLWEFPGGKIEVGESGEQCVIRECYEELGIMLRVECELTDVVYKYPDRTVHIYFYLCEIVSGVPKNKEHNAIAWITPNELRQYKFCPADAKMLKMLLEESDSILFK
ncbi:MAG: 8-oxo-dGTP diphosphatase MutT [Christensenellaceae bacterium]|nr:8-oxo-dGTP diphosphatase MutT [Christensenellaceae bacterium]